MIPAYINVFFTCILCISVSNTQPVTYSNYVNDVFKKADLQRTAHQRSDNYHRQRPRLFKDPFGQNRENGNLETKRELELGININVPVTEQPAAKNYELENVLRKVAGNAQDLSECPDCDAEETGLSGFPAMHTPRRILKPAFECDRWDASSRVCILERTVGSTVTFYLSTGDSKYNYKTNVTWRKELHVKNSKTRKEIILDPDDSPENIVVGRMGYELRVSPITEFDLGYNLFSATWSGRAAPLGKLFFMIRTVPLDMGFVYVGETIEINLHSFANLPARSLSFHWYVEKRGEHDGSLPSNMHVTSSGSSIKISELRQQQEGILACSVYTNRDILATKVRFFLKDLTKHNDILMLSPNHSLQFEKPSNRRVRNQRQRIRRYKRQEDINDLIEEVLKEPTTNPTVPFSTRKYLNRFTTYFNMGEEKVHQNSGFHRQGNAEAEIEDNLQMGANSNEDQLLSYVTDSEIQDISSTNILDQSKGNQRLDSVTDSNFRDNSLSNNVNQYKDDLIGSIQDVSLNNLDNSIVEVEGPQDAIENQETLPSNDGILPPVMPDQYLKPANGLSEQFAGNENSGVDVGRKNKWEKKDASTTGYYESDSKMDTFFKKKRITAEERIAKMVSYCRIDLECSRNAVCVESKNEKPGFCRCLQGFSGVGIFCRENTWNDAL